MATPLLRLARFFAAVVLALACALAPTLSPLPGSPASALTAPQEFNFTLEGKITRKEPGKLTVNTGENIIFRVRYDEKTEIRQADGSAGSEKDLRVGVVIRVEGDLTESGEIIAQKIAIQAEAASEKR